MLDEKELAGILDAVNRAKGGETVQYSTPDEQKFREVLAELLKHGTAHGTRSVMIGHGYVQLERTF